MPFMRKIYDPGCLEISGRRGVPPHAVEAEAEQLLLERRTPHAALPELEVPSARRQRRPRQRKQGPTC